MKTLAMLKRFFRLREVNEMELGYLDGKPITVHDLTSKTWGELRSKLKKIKWNGLPVIQAVKKPGEDVVVINIRLIPMGNISFNGSKTK